jgi:hypothetical protein
MMQLFEWQTKAAEYAFLAQNITDADLRRQYAELAHRYHNIAKRLEDGVMMAATSAGGPAKD